MTRLTARILGFTVAFAAVAAWNPMPLRAHDSLNGEIATLSRQIVANPQDAGLYLRRGELYRLAAEWAAAASDYDQAERLDPPGTEVHLCRAALALDAGNPVVAVQHVDRFLAVHPADAEALLLRSRARYAAGH